MTQIVIPYKPRAQFVGFHNLVPDKKRFAVLVCHRRMGKTVACVNHLIRDCIRNPGVYAYIGPTYKQTERIAWKYFHKFTEPIPQMKLNEAKLMATFPNGAMCYLLGSEQPDSLRGMGLYGAVLDEYQLHPPSLFGEVIAPCLADHHGYAIFAGTIRGKNLLYRLHEEKLHDPDWHTMYVRASESGIISQAELDVQRSLITPDEYRQEYELDPTAAIKGAIFGAEMRWLHDNNHICKIPPDNYAPVDCYWDLGMADYTVVIFMQSVGMERRIIDCYATHNQNLADIAKTLRDRGYRYGTHYLPHDAKQRALETGRTREEFLRTVLMGDIQIVERPQRKEDALAAVKLQYQKLWINEDLTQFVDAMEQYQQEYDEKNGVFRPYPLHNWCSHYADAVTQWAQVERRDFQPRIIQNQYQPNESWEDGPII